MSYNRAYNRINWVNESDGKVTPLGALNLNKMDSAIDILDQRIIELDSKTGNLSVVDGALCITYEE